MSEYGEPWRFKDPDDRREIVDKDGNEIAGFDGVVEHHDRVLACVNYCEGMESLSLVAPAVLRDEVWSHRLSSALELLDLYIGPEQGIADRREAFLIKHGWEKREDQWTSATNPTIKPLSWEWVKGDKKCSFGGALAEEAGVQFRRLK